MTSLARRVGHLERFEEETRRPMRERIHSVMARLGETLPAAEVEALVARYASAPQKVRRWGREGLSNEQIADRLMEDG